MSLLFASCGQSIGGSASASVLPMNIQDWFLLGLTGWISLQSKRLSRVFFNTTVRKHQFFGTQPSLYLVPYKLDYADLFHKVISLLFNMLSRFDKAFLPRSKSLNFMTEVTICIDVGAQENKICQFFHFSPNLP